MKFYDWLLGQQKSEKTAKNYASAIEGRVAHLAAHLDKGDFTLSEIQSADSFANVCQRFDPSGEILPLNQRGKDMYRRALVMYAEYRQSTQGTASTLQASFESAVEKALKDSSEHRKARLKAAPKKPTTSTVTTTVFNRNPDVVAEVLLRAGGNCEGCTKAAPFKRRSDGSPYLEVHHRTPLAQGGDDTIENAIALCPNCHRERHLG